LSLELSLPFVLQLFSLELFLLFVSESCILFLLKFGFLYQRSLLFGINLLLFELLIVSLSLFLSDSLSLLHLSLLLKQGNIGLSLSLKGGCCLPLMLLGFHLR